MEANTIHKEVSAGRQSVNYKEILMLDEMKLRIRIKSDSYDFQCFARVSVWSEENLRWEQIDFIPFANMQTPKGLLYKRGGSSEEHFRGDRGRPFGNRQRDPLIGEMLGQAESGC